jgi:hypothetical protein
MMRTFGLYKKAIEDSICNGLLLEGKQLTGLSGKKLIGTLQRLAAANCNDDNCYLEIGVFQGLTLISVGLAIRDKSQAYGIDNFSLFDRKGENQEIVQDRVLKNSLSNTFLINEDYEIVLENLKTYLGNKKVSVYFIDGPHDYRSQLMCLLLVKPHLSRSAVIIIDDCNYRHVRQANRDFLVTNKEFKLLFESYTRCHPKRMDLGDAAVAKEGWWNGINVIVRDGQNSLESVYPPTEQDRSLFENGHIIQSARYARFGARAVLKLNLLMKKKFVHYAVETVQLYNEIRKTERSALGRFDSLNTYSDGLPSERFNPSIESMI